ncbi:MAG: hypothetical protein ACREPP_01955 [Rhodanobacteraceae bacterium]
MRLQPFVLLTLLSCATPAAFAQSGPATDDATQTTPAEPTRERQPLDANHDGVITREEAQARPGIAKHFDQIDTNHDGGIDRAELRAIQNRMKSHREQKQGQQTAPAEASSSD